MSNSIVTENVSLLLAPEPNNLQAMGAMISAGATTLTAGSFSFLTQASDFTALLAPPIALTSLAWSSGTVIATASESIPGRNTGDVFRTTVAGAVPTQYNGLVLATVTGSNTFTYSLAANPGAVTSPGTFAPPSQGELQAAVNTFFSQPNAGQGVYVLELGPSDGSTGPALLQSWIQVNPGEFYSYLVPQSWDGTAGLNNLIGAYSTPTSKTYFFVTTNLANFANYTTKNVVAEVTSPGAPLTEFSIAAAFQKSLAYAPSSTNRMTPFAFTYLYGVTPYPLMGNQATLAQLKAANINYVDTGAEGGISQYILKWGRVASGVDFTFWYAADWAQIYCDQATAAAVIQGSNNPINPLYYNQPGINTLQDVTVATMQNGVSYGLFNGTVTQTALDPITFGQNLNNGVYAGQNVVNAVPFLTYTQANPANYGQGIYGGLTVVCLPQVGFTQVIFQILVTDIISQF